MNLRSKRLLCLAVAGCAATAAWGQSKPSSLGTLLQVGDLSVSAEEFQYLYEKNYNASDSVYLTEHLNAYLELYTKFKLKVAEAQQQGYDTTRAFVSELAGYQQQLAKPYLSDPSITERIVREAYDRLQQEVRASHILIMVKDWGNPADTLAAYRIAESLKARAEAGEDFGKLAEEQSQDPSAKFNRGDLGYFTSMQMVYEFENAAYATPVGEIAGPVRTRFGYHLIRVADRIPARGSCKASHIMVRATRGLAAEDSLAAAKKAHEIYAKLQEGADWNDLCRQFSDDTNTREAGGALPWFSTGQMVPEFAEVAYAMKDSGDVSAPVLSPYGWHIIRLDGKKGIDPFETMERTIKQRISRDSRSELSEKLFVQRLKDENGYREFADAKAAAIAAFDDSLLEGNWMVPDGHAHATKPLMGIGDQTATVQDFFLYAAERQYPGAELPLPAYAERMFESFVSERVLAYEEAHLAEKHPEYRHLLNEYREGIMLFNIMSTEIWDKAMVDTAGLRTYFEANSGRYRWGRRVKAVVASVANAELLEAVKQQLRQERFEVVRGDLEPLTYAFQDTALNPDQQVAVDRAILSLRRHPEYTLRFEAFYPAAEGEAMAKARLQAIADYYAPYELDASRIDMVATPMGDEASAVGYVAITLFTPSAKALEKQYNEEHALALQIDEGWFEQGANAVLDARPWEVGTYETESNGRKVFVRVEAVDEPRGKTLDECRGQAISDYQQYLEAKWLEALRKEHRVKLDKKVLKQLQAQGLAKKRK
jgi:peptidyl-prolyl cis-trans isomerase SurA